MSVRLNGNKYSQLGTRVPSELLPTAIRYEKARALAFEHLGQPHRAEECLALKRFYERRKMKEQN